MISYLLIQEKHTRPLIAYLYAPMIVMIVANVFMFVWAAFSFYQRSVESSQVINISRKSQMYYLMEQLMHPHSCAVYNRKCVTQIDAGSK